MAADSAALDQAIAAQPDNAKLYGKRCTARLDAGQYAEALDDAKSLVRLLPDAPVGYLKAARCYRLLKKLKASQKMLDIATEHAADEHTIRAIRTEMRKLQADEKALAEERSKTFAEQLPEEIFLEIISYLDQTDRVHAAQVNQRWRGVLHSHPEIWDTMFVNIASQGDKARRANEQACQNQLAFYMARVPEGRYSLKNISIHGKTGLLELNGWLTAYLDALFRDQHYIVANIEAISFTNLSIRAANQFLESSKQSWGKSIRALRMGTFGGETIVGEYFRDRELYPHLEILEALGDKESAQHDPGWPHLAHRVPATKMAATRGLRRLEYTMHRGLQAIAADSSALDEYSIADTIDSSLLASLEILRVVSSHNARLLCTDLKFNRLRSLTLDGINMAVGFTCHPQTLQLGVPIWQHFDPFMNSTLSLPCLEELQMNCSRTTSGISNKRVDARPALTLCRLDAPKLRALHIEDYSSIYGGAQSGDTHEREKDAFIKFANHHPQLRTLKLVRTACPELEQCLDNFTELTSLHLSHVELSRTFLRSLTSPKLPRLQHLALPWCTQVGNGDLLRLVKSKDGKLQSLDIEGCTELQKEAVDWLKGNVPKVNFKGWRTRDEPRLFGLR